MNVDVRWKLRGSSCAFIALLSILACLLVTAETPPRLPGSELFADGAVWRLKLEIPAEGIKSLRSEPRQYVRGTLREGTNVLHNVAVRLKGSTGSFRALDDKPAFTVNCDHFVPGQPFHRLSKIHLNNSVEDPSYLNEKLGSELFRAAGVPAPLVSHALVELNGRRLGLYVLKEGFADEFLTRHFQRTDGNLYEAEPGGRSDVTEPMRRNSGSGATNYSDLQRLAMAAGQSDPSRRWMQLHEALDMDRFLAFMAMEVLSGHRDGYALARNNFRLYHDPASDRFIFLPDGMDQLFGRADFPVQPHMAGVVAKATMETPAGRRAYRERLTSLFTNCFRLELMTNQVRAWSTAIAPNLTRAEARDLRRESSELCERIRQRVLHVSKQLAAPESVPVQFENGIARLKIWRPGSAAAGSHLGQTTTDGRMTLHIRGGSRPALSWRTAVWLEAGRYRFEGLARTAGVKPSVVDKKHGASLGVAGQNPSGAKSLTADTEWTKLEAEFEVPVQEAAIELLCVLRADAGDAWFDVDSLQLVRLDSKGD